MNTNSTKGSLIVVAMILFFSSCKSDQNSAITMTGTENSQEISVPKQKELSARESEPDNFAWMQGFPPPPENRLWAADGSFFRFPALRWSVMHMREFMPTVNVSRGLGPSSDLNYVLDAAIDEVEFQPWGSDTPMTWKQSLSKNYTDGIIILHRGRVVYEKYFGELTELDLHAVMSLSKSFTGTLASVLVAEGAINEDARMNEYVPELSGSAFGDATIRQVMDMTTALSFSEDYSDPNAEIWAFSSAGNPLPKPLDYQGPVGYLEYLQAVQKNGKHGEAFGYKTVNTDALGWVISRVTGKKVSDYLSERIWSKLGAEMDAYYQIDALGIPFAGGGFNAGLRDLARFGELIRNKGMFQGEQIIPRKAVEDIEKGGDRDAFARSPYSKLEGWSYRNMWWMTHNKHGAYAARGVHGQTIYIDPEAEMVLVRLASHPVAGNAANDPFSLPAYHAVAQYLLSK
jgi:CubicO group peptidase (beta-lactamase class C family)